MQECIQFYPCVEFNCLGSPPPQKKTKKPKTKMHENCLYYTSQEFGLQDPSIANFLKVQESSWWGKLTNKVTGWLKLMKQEQKFCADFEKSLKQESSSGGLRPAGDLANSQTTMRQKGKLKKLPAPLCSKKSEWTTNFNECSDFPH